MEGLPSLLISPSNDRRLENVCLEDPEWFRVQDLSSVNQGKAIATF